MRTHTKKQNKIEGAHSNQLRRLDAEGAVVASVPVPPLSTVLSYTTKQPTILPCCSRVPTIDLYTPEHAHIAVADKKGNSMVHTHVTAEARHMPPKVKLIAQAFGTVLEHSLDEVNGLDAEVADVAAVEIVGFLVERAAVRVAHPPRAYLAQPACTSLPFKGAGRRRRRGEGFGFTVYDARQHSLVVECQLWKWSSQPASDLNRCRVVRAQYICLSYSYFLFLSLLRSL